MGELQRAAQQYDAPWPDATAEENAAYSQQAQMGNIDFEREVGAVAGPSVAPYVKADRATYIGPQSYNLRGFYIPEDFSENPERYDNEMQDKVLRRAQELGAIPSNYDWEDDTVYAVGGGASPEVWAHEFDHRRMELNKMNPLMGQERAVLLRQAFYADDPIAWKQAVGGWYAATQHKNDYKTIGDIEENLKKAVNTWKDSFFEEEAKIRKEKGNKPKKRKWAFDSYYADAQEQYEKRRKAWSLDRYNQIVDRLNKLAEEAQNGKPDIAE